jgi:hypothetical protein
MGQTIGIFIIGLIGYGFVYAIVYLVASIGIDTKDPAIRAALAGNCAIAASILAAVIAYAMDSEVREANANARHNNAQDREDARRKS